MPTPEEYGGLPIEARLSRLEQTPAELELAIFGKTDTELSRRPDARNWAAKEIASPLRTGSPGLQRTMTTTSPSFTEHSKVGHDLRPRLIASVRPAQA